MRISAKGPCRCLECGSGQEETCMEELQVVAYPGILFVALEFQQIQLGTEDRENGDLVAP